MLNLKNAFENIYAADKIIQNQLRPRGNARKRIESLRVDVEMQRKRWKFRNFLETRLVWMNFHDWWWPVWLVQILIRQPAPVGHLISDNLRQCSSSGSGTAGANSFSLSHSRTHTYMRKAGRGWDELSEEFKVLLRLQPLASHSWSAHTHWNVWHTHSRRRRSLLSADELLKRGGGGWRYKASDSKPWKLKRQPQAWQHKSRAKQQNSSGGSWEWWRC